MIYVLSGGAPLYAIIAVTYPSGSICTCGGKAAKDTSGYALFNVKPGTYTVECHTSDNSKSKSTSITVAESDKGKCKSIMLSYTLVLFDNGTYAAETGGWNGISNKKLTASVSGIATGEDGFGAFYTKNKVDLSGFSTIHFTVSSKSGDENYDSYFGASNHQSANSGNYSSFAAKTIFKDSAVGKTLTVDISSINAAHYIRGTVHAWGGGAHSNFSVSKVWLD